VGFINDHEREATTGHDAIDELAKRDGFGVFYSDEDVVRRAIWGCGSGPRFTSHGVVLAAREILLVHGLHG
jgi:hypothetical protein